MRYRQRRSPQDDKLIWPNESNRNQFEETQPKNQRPTDLADRKAIAQKHDWKEFINWVNGATKNQQQANFSRFDGMARIRSRVVLSFRSGDLIDRGQNAEFRSIWHEHAQFSRKSSLLYQQQQKKSWRFVSQFLHPFDVWSEKKESLSLIKEITTKKSTLIEKKRFKGRNASTLW